MEPNTIAAFQSLIGRKRNFNKAGCDRQCIRLPVSIPNREKEKFQPENMSPPFITTLFQSLIGRKRNFNMTSGIEFAKFIQFQSLIGRKRNFNGQEYTPEFIPQVSIPNREKEKFQPKVLLLRLNYLIVSIPNREKEKFQHLLQALYDYQ